MAGRSGLNLTNAEQEIAFLKRYGAAEEWLTPALSAFSPSMMKAWAEELGQPCFTGSSGRVFPKTMKASPLLRAWLKRLSDRGVRFRAGMRWQGWNDRGNVVLMSRNGSEEILAPDATVLALGGGSWARLGSDGGWTSLLSAAGVPVAALRPANCGFHVEWSEGFKERFSGVPLKRIALSFAGETCRGEAVIDPKAASVFARIMGTGGKQNSLSFGVQAGFTFHGIVPWRSDDVLGLGWGMSSAGSRAWNFNRDSLESGADDVLPLRTEHHIELTWQAPVWNGVVVQPDFQYIHHVGGGILNASTGRRVGDAAVFGLNVTTSF